MAMQLEQTYTLGCGGACGVCMLSTLIILCTCKQAKQVKVHVHVHVGRACNQPFLG